VNPIAILHAMEDDDISFGVGSDQQAEVENMEKMLMSMH